MRWHSTVRQGHDDSATRGPVPTSPQKAARFPNKRQLHECSESFRRRKHVNPTDKYGVGTTRNNRRPQRPREGFSPEVGRLKCQISYLSLFTSRSLNFRGKRDVVAIKNMPQGEFFSVCWRRSAHRPTKLITALHITTCHVLLRGQTHTPTAWPQTETADTQVGTSSQRIRIGSSLNNEAETTPMTPSELTPVASPKAVSGGWVSEPRRRRAQPAATLRRTPFGHQRRVSRGRTTARAFEEPRINFSRNQCKL